MNNLKTTSSQINPRDKANWLSLFTFSYTRGIFRKAIKKDLEEEDIYKVLKSCKSDSNGDRLEKYWIAERQTKEKVALPALLWKCFGKRFVCLGLIHLTWKIITGIYEPEAIGKLVASFNPNQSKLTFDDAIYYGCLMIALKFGQALYLQNYHIYLQQLAIQIRTSFCSLIYRKALKMTPTAMNEISLGNIITVITKDVFILETSLAFFSNLWVECIKAIVTCYLIYNKMGAAGFIGVACFAVILPVQIYVGKMIKKLRMDLNKKTDERLQATQETLSAIKIIKMYTWETIFTRKIDKKREKEMRYLMKTFYLKTVNLLTGLYTSKLGFYIVIMTYIYMTDIADSEVIFYVMKCFKDLKHSLGLIIPIGLGRGAEVIAACKRINNILNCEEISEDGRSEHAKPQILVSHASVKIKGRTILSNITTTIKPGLTVVTGPLGCGKSSLLKLFLNHFSIAEGKIISEGSISYSSQDPWLFPSTIKQNILFGEHFDPVRYERVIEICALKYDFALFANGDETIVADGGKNLSGGQQARINLARAIYKQSDIYLLDDPLHALDPHVQDFIYENCLKKYLKNTYCVLVTHNQKHQKNADRLILMDKGEIKYDGITTNPDIDVKTITETHTVETENEKQEEIDEIDEDCELIKNKQLGQTKVYTEVKKIGKVSWSVYKKYFAFGGGIISILILLLFYIVTESSESYSSRVLINWINLQENITNYKILNISSNSTEYIKIEQKAGWTLNLYSGIILGSLIADLLTQFIFVNFFRKVSTKLHNTMVESVVSAKMSFYDNYFIGNILNRFSQDLNSVDEQLPNTINVFLWVLLGCVGIVALVTSVSWIFLIPATILIVFMAILRHIYMPAARSLKRLEAATRSPLIGHLNSSIEGLTTIRARNVEKILAQEFDNHQDLYTSAYYMTFCVRCAFAFFMDIFAATFTTFVVGKLVFFGSGESSGDVGLAITIATSLPMLVQFALIQWSDLENNMTSAERVLEYVDIPQESQSGLELQNWPTVGEVVFKNVSLTYKLEKVLKDITFKVSPKQKIGIVGRTGAGKSSILSILFRLYNYDGSILIDGVDIATLSPKHLRKHISIIPQDPMLFEGTIRENIDPLGDYSDEEIWHTLSTVQIADQVEGLDFPVTDHGSSFSTGQRQLICLARAIIRQNKIVVMDEATANMDPQTENLVQKTIENNFAECTVFIIAHRLKSVLNCNKILVMDRGEIAAFGEPSTLMKDKTSFFAKMLDSDNY